MPCRRVWIINQDNCTPENGSYNRSYNLAKYFTKRGISPVIFVGSKTRHSKKAIECGRKPYIIDNSHGFPIVYINADDSSDNKLKRIVGIARYHSFMRLKGKHFASLFGKPDAIIGSSPYPLAPVVAIRLAKRINAVSVCEVRDLWPLDLEVYGIAKRNGLIVSILYKLEKWNYENADAVVTTMEGGLEYIREKGWITNEGGLLPSSKVFHVNNGVDLEVFDENLKTHHYRGSDALIGPKKKVLYAGSIRLKNGLGQILDIAERLLEEDIDFVIAGDGSERELLSDEAKDRGLSNLHFIGQIDKSYIPSFLSKGDLLFLHAQVKPEINRFGSSPNKLFDYLASGRAVIADLPSNYSIVNRHDCGIERFFESADDYASCIKSMLSDREKLRIWGNNARVAAQGYSFEKLAGDYVEIIERIGEGKNEGIDSRQHKQ